ncbi:MAG: hypothetical protein MJE77_07050 [Proteobacteria bacterium]|nr:hypothetical protein [Pseudomonadota bacterium]
MIRCALAILAVSFSSCCPSDVPPDEIILRVSASHGLGDFHDPDSGGSTSYARDLVYLGPDKYQLEHRGPTELALTPTSAPQDLDRFCASLCIDGQTQVWRDGEYCIIEFDSEPAKRDFADQTWLEIGPFRLREPEKIGPTGSTPRAHIDLLDQCDRTDIDVIRIKRMTVDEEWQEFYGRRIDVIPTTSIANYGWFKDLDSARTAILPALGDVALHFNVQKDPWSDRNVRMTLASAIDPDAIARVACAEDYRCFIGRDPIPTPKSLAPLPREISLVVLASESGTVRAAKAIRYHADTKRGASIRIDEVTMPELNRRRDAGDFDLMLMPLKYLASEDSWKRIEVQLRAHSRYRTPQFSAAVNEGNVDLIRRLIDRDIPALRLYTNLQFAAIDQQFCYRQKPDSQVSWRWLAYLYPYPCGP